MTAATEHIPLTSPHNYTMAIIDEIAKAHGMTRGDILGRDRKRKFVTARRAAIVAVVAARPNLNYPEIGRIFGLDHTTCMFHLQKAGVFMPRANGKKGNANVDLGQTASSGTPATVPSQADDGGRDGGVPIAQA